MSNFTDSAQSKQINQQEHNHAAGAKRVVIRAQEPNTGDFVNIAAVDNGDGTYGLSVSGGGGGGGTTNYITQFYSDDDYTYICKATPGTALSSTSWQVKRLDSSGSKRYAGGDANFDNAATNLSTVQGYSYS